MPVIGTALFAGISQLGQTYHLTPAQVKVLLQLGTQRQMTVGEIGNALACSMPAASELVDRLVDAGHLVRSSDPSDRRRVLIHATPESAHISAHLRELRESQVRYALDQLAPHERPIFIRSLKALVAGLTHGQDASGARAVPTPADGDMNVPASATDRRAANGLARGTQAPIAMSTAPSAPGSDS